MVVDGRQNEKYFSLISQKSHKLMMKLKKEMVTSRQSTNVLCIYNYHRFQMLQMDLYGWHAVNGVFVNGQQFSS